jgi:hypothetical protein
MSIKPVVLRFRFDNFEGLPSEVDESVTSEVQTDCNGNKWKLHLKPGGDSRAEEPGCVGVYLFNKNQDSVELNTRFEFCVKDAHGGNVAEKNRRYEWKFIPQEKGFGCYEYIKRSTILDAANAILQDGALCIEVTIIQVKDCDENIYQPPNALSSRMLEFLKSKEQTDVSFTVGRKVFHAHSQIIYLRKCPYPCKLLQ